MTDRIDYVTRRAIVNAIINETEDHGDAIHANKHGKHKMKGTGRQTNERISASS